MKIGYIIQKILRKVFNRPCVNRSNIDKVHKLILGQL